jgi:DNA-binding SARP family transcriptional activator
VVRCFGSFQVIREGQVIGPDAWRRAAPRRLLQFLLLRDRPVHREEIVEALWPDQDPRHAANRLRVALSQLRRILEPDLAPRRPSAMVVASGVTIHLARDRFDIDLDHFRHALARASSSQGDARRAALTEAVRWYAEDVFAEDPFEEWVQRDRDRLSRQHLEALTLLAEAEEAAGQHQAALVRWQEIADRDPGAEHAHRGLIRSCLALGRNADALRAFEACRRALEDLGTVPSTETLTLRERIPQAEPDTRG